MKHILNEMNDEERNSIRSQYTGTLSVQTGKFKQLVENKLGNAKPLVEQYESFTAFDEQAPERRVKDMDSGKITGTHKHGVGYTPNEFGKSLGHSSHPTSIPNYSKFDDDDDEMGMMRPSRMSEPNRRSYYGESNEFDEDIDDVDYGGENGLNEEFEDGGASRVEYVINKIDGVDELIELLGGEDSAERILRRYKPLGLESLDDLIEYKGGYPEEEDYGDEGASRMNESDETTLKEKIMTAIRNSTSNKEEIIDVLEKILREKKGVGYVTKDKVLKNFKK